VRRDPRAIVFDLDDTLYPYRQFKLSGFDAVARRLARLDGVDARQVGSVLRRSARGAMRGRELQACLDALSLPASLVDDLLTEIRTHEPSLVLPRSAARLLTRVRHEGWRVGILTNGAEPVQRRKIDALTLPPLVDAIVFASAHGTGVGKPERAPFEVISGRLGVPASRTVFVGNDERCDIEGAIGAGMRAIYCAIWTVPPVGTRAHGVAHRFHQIPRLAEGLLEAVADHHAA
jgi:putative hydrolase of the HAD superfamily